MEFLDLAYRGQCCKLCCSKKGLVDSQTGKTKRRFADIQQDVLHNGVVGSKTRPLQISGTPIAGHGMSLDDMHACFVVCIGTCDNLWSTPICNQSGCMSVQALLHCDVVAHGDALVETQPIVAVLSKAGLW